MNAATYDSENDLLILKVDSSDYETSLEYDDVIIDRDADGNITGMRIFDASKAFKLNKAELKNIKDFTFTCTTQKKTLQLCIQLMLPQKTIKQELMREAIESECIVSL